MVTYTPEEIAHRKAVYRDGAYNYPRHSWYMIATAVAIAAILNFGSIFWAWHKRHELRRGARNLSKPYASLETRKVSKGRILAAAATAMRILSYRVRIPFVSMSVMELFLTLGYMVALFCWDFINTLGLTLNYWQSRAAAIGTAQLPILVALALKNNVLEFFIGISHEKMNLMHRTTSRVVLLSIWIHSAGMARGIRNYLWAENWVIMGTVATIAQTCLTILGTKWIRQRFYEFFWITHCILVLVFLVSAYMHCLGLGMKTPFRHYVWPCFLIWGMDRFARYVRYFILGNFHKPNRLPATIEIISPDAYRITVRRSFPGFFPGKGWLAGQHMFIAFPTIGPIESHPFTIASIAEDIPAANVRPGETGDERELMWIVRTRNGFTKRLRDKAQSTNGGVLQAPIFLDGPYGVPPDITGFTTCVFIAGGSGIAYTMPRMRELFNQVNDGVACARRVVFIWALRHPSHIDWMATQLDRALASKPKDVSVTILVYVTSASSTPSHSHHSHTHSDHSHSPTSTVKSSLRSPSPTSPTSPTTLCEKSLDDEKTGVPTLSKHDRVLSTYSTSSDPEACTETVGSDARAGEWEEKGVEIRWGRPDIHGLLKEAVTTSEGAVSVDVSGPETLVATIRKALSSPFAGPMNVLRGCPSVQLNVEDFTM